jgi:hypothetical protein
MTRFVSRIAGVAVGMEQVDGRNVMFQTPECCKCDATLRINTKGSPMPEEVVFKKMRQSGWDPDRGGQHLCPACIEDMAKPKVETKAKAQPEPVQGRGGLRKTRPITYRGTDYPSMNALARALNLSMSTIHNAFKAGRVDDLEARPDTNEEPMNKIDTPTPAAPVEAPTRAMSRDDKRAIFRRLDEVYNVPTGRYVDDWTDHRLATEMNMPRAWIAQVRDEAYGPEGGNDEMEKLLADIAATHRKLEGAVDTCLTAAAEAEKLNAEVKDLQTRMTRLKAAVGPQAGRV